MQSNSNLKLTAIIGLGGAVGAMGRYGISVLLTEEGFPIATLCTNLFGCFLLSFLVHQNHIKKLLPPSIFTALTVGLIGSFTTFSTFSVETIALWNSTKILAVLYVMISVVGGLLFCLAGYKVAIGNREKAER